MTCDEVNELMIDYIEGELPKRQTLEIGKHLEECTKCAQEVREMESVIDTVSVTVEDPGDTYFSSIFPRVMERIEQNEGLSWYRRLMQGLNPVQRWSVVGAPALLAVMILVVTFMPQILPWVKILPQGTKSTIPMEPMKISTSLMRPGNAADDVADLSDSEVERLHSSLMVALEDVIHEENLLKSTGTATVLPHNTVALPSALDGLDNEALGDFMDKLSEMDENTI